MKTCTKCNTEKDLSNFSADKGGKNGLRSKCKSCDSAAKALWSSSWIAKYTRVPGNAPWWEKLEGEDRKNAEAWILQNKETFTYFFAPVEKKDAA